MKVRKGFTLVELLIVIVIIGILAAGMMLASGAATATATATTIISDLKSLQGAAGMFYADNLYTDSDTVDIDVDSLSNYMADYNKIKSDGGYCFLINGHGWWVGYEGTKLQNQAVRDKLKAKAKDIGLYGASEAVSYTAADQRVYIKAH